MKRDVAIGHGRLRLWRDEPPVAAYLSEQVLARDGAVNGVSIAILPKTLCIEVCLPTGPRSLYGLLGASFIPDITPHCKVRVGVNSAAGARFVDALAPASEVVRIGLPDEYAHDLLDKLTEEMVARAVSGTLNADQAAHGAIGSSRAMFVGLGKLLVRMLVDRIEEKGEEELRQIVRSAIFDRPGKSH